MSPDLDSVPYHAICDAHVSFLTTDALLAFSFSSLSHIVANISFFLRIVPTAYPCFIVVIIMKTAGLFTLLLSGSVTAFAPATKQSSTTALHGLFDKWTAGGSGKDDLDEQWEAQQEILRNRRAPQAERDAYFQKVEERRSKASKDQVEKWAWQTKTYGKGEDPIDEWKKRREAGTISDLDDQYGDPKKIGGIPLPMASFGVGGEFGVS